MPLLALLRSDVLLDCSCLTSELHGSFNVCEDITFYRRVAPQSRYIIKDKHKNVVTKLRSKKEVFQPHLPVRLPCYDLAPVTSFALDRSSRSRSSGTPGFHGLTGGVYKARERIHRAMADARLLANPTSWSRVADSNPN